LPLPGLVRFAEKGIYSGAQVHAYLSEQLAEFNLEDYAAFVLGCTHFNLFKQELRTLLPPQMHFVDGNAGTVRQLIRRTVDLPATHRSPPGVTYFASGRPITDPAQLQFIQNVLAHLEKMYPIE
ncbi:MAG: glutamate racemase, partial [Ruminococcaceae bacterium]|nr:glutamate racemase [Oscillospiraceae bacterium]